jgi:hypothetical protein
MVVACYDTARVVPAGTLKSLDGVWGVRFGHTTEAKVSGLMMTKQ